MPRNSSGTMSAPAGQPAVAGTVISSATFNSLVADFVAEFTDSASRSGKGAFSAPVKTPDGSAAAPSHAVTSEATGWYKSAAGEFAIALAGALAAKFTAVGLNIFGAARAFLQSTAANSVVQILGNRNATDTGADVELSSAATRTSGKLVSVINNGVEKLYADYQGLLALASQAGPLQPASLWTAITPNANWTAGSGLAYWKDATGIVRLKGTATFATGAATGVFTLPAGFRPIAIRTPLGLDTSVAGCTPVAVNIDATTGLVSILGVTLVNTHVYSFDGVNFLAEQ